MPGFKQKYFIVLGREINIHSRLRCNLEKHFHERIAHTTRSPFKKGESMLME